MMKPAVTNPAFRKLSYVFILVSCFLSFNAYTQPTPQITGEQAVCPGAEETYQTNFIQGNAWTWSVSPGGQIVQDNGHSVVVQWSSQPNSNQWILVSETDPMMQEASDTLSVFISNNILVCENSVNISLDQNGTALVTPDMLLDGYYNTYGNYVVSLALPNGIQLGNTLYCSHIGKTIIGKVTDHCTGNSCWSNVNLEDKKAPQWTCPQDTVEIPCDTDIDNYPHPPVADNCDPDPVISMTGIQIYNDDICQGVLIVRHWVATDNYDNESHCTQVLQINPDQPIVFPDDRHWQCDEYQAHPNITDPTVYTGDLNTTGSGVPVGAIGAYCPYSYLNHDDTLASCGNTFKIIRTWTVLNWCTQQVVLTDSYGNDNEQHIKIIDLEKPTMTVPPITLRITEPGVSSLTCRSKDLLPAPVVADGCGNVTVQIFTTVGEAVYVNGVDGKEGGFVPNPGLKLGQHQIIYKAIDDCGNITQFSVTALVVDDEAPTVICDEITDVSLDQFGNAEVFAETFNDGSYDNCCISHFEVKRMGEPDLNFGPVVPFDCNDDEVMVVLRAYDCFDNYGDCMVVIHVQDKILPTCIPPQNKSISCKALPPDMDQDWVESFGEAFSFDNCVSDITEEPYSVDINACGDGEIVRYFKATDAAGNHSSGYCEQHIKVIPESDWLISFPPNWIGECGDSIASIDLEAGEFSCEMLAVSYEDQYFALSSFDSACFKIVRTWKVINWCTYVHGQAPVIVPTNEFGVQVDETDYNNAGYYEYQQIIKIYDTSAPVLSAPYTYEFCTGDSLCLNGPAFLPIQIDGECSSNYEIVHHIDLGNDGSYEIQGLGFFDGTLPIGTHKVLYLVEDGCQNQSEISFTFTIRDCKKPTPICHNGLIVEIMQTGMVPVCASQLNDYSFDNCGGPLIFSFSEDTNDTCRIFDCSNVSTQVPVEIWVTDVAGNQDFCETFVEIQDNMGHCANGNPLVGYIQTHQGAPLQDVSVQLNSTLGQQSVLTDDTGMYQFSDLPVGNDYTVTPVKNDDFLNGVTTFDLVMISRHILGLVPLQTPYQLIAADVNRSGTVTTFDLVELRKLILFIVDELPNNTSWRFVDKDYVFPNPNNPWSEVFPEIINLNNYSSALMDADFVAVKIGDVNGSATTTDDDKGTNGAVGNRGSGELMFSVEDRWLEAGEKAIVTFQAKDFKDVYGFQCTIDFEKDVLDFLSVQSTDLLKEENYGTSLVDEGAITSLWFETEMESLEDGDPVLVLEFQVKTSCYLSNVVNISSRFTHAEAYIGEDMAVVGVDVEFTTGVTAANQVFQDGFYVNQNVPNPFSGMTTIGFELPVAGKAILTIFDTAGRVVLEKEGQYQAGYHEMIIESKDLPSNGTLFYRLESTGHTAVRQMNVID